MAVSDTKLEAMAQAIAEALLHHPEGWKIATAGFKLECLRAARNALAVMEKSEL